MMSKIRLSFALSLLWLGLAVSSCAFADDSPAQAPAISKQDAARLAAELRDDTQRERLIKDLETLAAADAGSTSDSEPGGLFGGIADKLQDLGTDLAAAASVVIDAPLIATWLERQAEDPAARRRWSEVSEHVAGALLAALAAASLAGFLLGPPRRRLVGVSGGNTARVISLVLIVFLDILPVLAFATAGESVINFEGARFATTSVVMALIGTVVSARLLLVVARGILVGSREVGLRIPGVSEETASYLYVWIRRLVSWSVYGFGAVGATWFLGVPGALFAVLQKAVALVLTVLAVVFVLQNRHGVAEWLRPRLPEQAPSGAEDGAEAILAEPTLAPRQAAISLLRSRFADVWHVLAIVYILGLFGAYALRLTGGFSFLIRATALSMVVLLGSRVLVSTLKTLAARGFAVPEDLSARFPTLEARSNRYLPIFNALASFLVSGFAFLVLLEVWGIPSFAWFASNFGRRLTGSAVTIGSILIAAFLAWELISAAVDRYLAGIDGAGNLVQRSARMRTLLPLLRNVTWVTLAIFAGLLILSELGLNIAPLLAGAGVVGLAIGFGSQALVKDVITGLFILIEDTIAVGDVVDLGGTHAGVVEAISIRTIKLRDEGGGLHTVPFSDVTKVRNRSKDFGVHVIEFGIPYDADPERAMALMRDVAETMRADPAWAGQMPDGIQIDGVSGFQPGAVMLLGRIKTPPLKQFAVGREYNLRLRKALAEAGIAIRGGGGGQVVTVSDDLARLLARPAGA